MTDIYLLIQALISGLVCGLILFQSIFVAPVVFRELPEESRPIILRSLFPKLFKSIAIGGFLFTLSAFLAGSDIFLPYIIGIFTFFSGLICNLMVNPTNLARDEGNDNAFKRLHTVSVVLTMLVLLSNFLWTFL